MRIALFALGLALLANDAIALSCIRPTVERAFNAADAATESYLPVFGQFEDVDLTPGPVVDEIPSDSHGTARFVGKSVSRNGFGAALDVEVSITLRCLAHWCGGLSEGQDVLTFLRLADSNYAFETGPCGASAFYSPGKSELIAMRRCLRDGPCEPQF